MHAFLTFIRKNNQDIHMLGIKNPENIIELSKFNLKSGQPIIAVVIDKELLSLYILDSLGNIMQIYGKNDSLFDLNKIYDLSLVNLKKYNYIKTLLINVSLRTGTVCRKRWVSLKQMSVSWSYLAL